MNQSKELLRKQLALLAEQSKSAAEDDLPGLSSAMVDVYDRLKPVGFGGSLFRGVVIFFALADLLVNIPSLPFVRGGHLCLTPI